MNSGKSTALCKSPITTAVTKCWWLNQVLILKVIKCLYLVLVYKEVDILLRPDESLKDYNIDYSNISCILVDEAQF